MQLRALALKWLLFLRQAKPAKKKLRSNTNLQTPCAGSSSLLYFFACCSLSNILHETHTKSIQKPSKKVPKSPPRPPLGAPGPPLVTDPVLRHLPESTFYDFGIPSGTPLAAKMGPWRAKKGTRCDKSIKHVAPEEVSEKELKQTPHIMNFGTPWNLENHAVACACLKLSRF